MTDQEKENVRAISRRVVRLSMLLVTAADNGHDDMVRKLADQIEHAAQVIYAEAIPGAIGDRVGPSITGLWDS